MSSLRGYSLIQKLKKNPPAWKRGSQNNIVWNTNYIRFFQGKLEKVTEYIVSCQFLQSLFKNVLFSTF